MMNTDLHHLQQKLDGVRMRFLESLDGQARNLQIASVHLKDPSLRDSAIRTIGSAAHKIKGTAKTLRLSEIGEGAEALELLASDAKKNFNLNILTKACQDFIFILRRSSDKNRNISI